MGLTVLWPEPPSVLVEALDVFGVEYNRAQAWAREQRERERKEAGANG